MAVIRSGASSTDLTVDTTYLASRVSTYPISGVLGEYVVSTTTTNVAASLPATDCVFSLRWNSGTSVMLLRAIAITGMQSVTTTSAISYGFEAVIARGYTVSDTGGTVLTLGALQKKRTSYASSAMADMRKYGTAAAIVNGTRVLDTQGFGAFLFNTNSTAAPTAQVGYTKLYSPTLPDEAPIVLAANEGIVIRGTDTGPTGTWRVGITLSWVEMALYPA